MGQLEGRACFISRRNLPRSQGNSSKYGKFPIRLDIFHMNYKFSVDASTHNDPK